MEHQLHCTDCDEEFRVILKSKTPVEFCPMCGSAILPEEDDDLLDDEDDDEDDEDLLGFDDEDDDLDDDE